MSTLIKENGAWKTVANLSQSDVIRNPDWANAVAITSLPYTAPEDGIIVGFSGYGTPSELKVNGVIVSRGIDGSDYNQIQCPVSKGDILSGTYGTTSLSFIPFKMSIAEGFITPEYIRNLHDPDWLQAESITAAQLNTGWTATKRGIVTGVGYGPTLNSCVAIILNNSIAIGVFGGTDSNYGSLHSPVNVGDIVKAESNVSTAVVQFVPYKAQ